MRSAETGISINLGNKDATGVRTKVSIHFVLHKTKCGKKGIQIYLILWHST